MVLKIVFENLTIDGCCTSNIYLCIFTKGISNVGFGYILKHSDNFIEALYSIQGFFGHFLKSTRLKLAIFEFFSWILLEDF